MFFPEFPSTLDCQENCIHPWDSHLRRPLHWAREGGGQRAETLVKVGLGAPDMQDPILCLNLLGVRLEVWNCHIETFGVLF